MQMFAAFATDMYTPALPTLPAYFHTSEALASSTVMIFFLFMLIGMLVFGPISDKYGRRPVLFAGSAIYALASFAIIFAPSIWVLLAGRICEALGAGMASVVGMAVIKDLFSGKTRENVLLWAQVFSVLGPIAAPLIGGATLLVFDWRAAFVILTALGIFAFVMTFFFKESLPVEKRLTGSTLSSFKGIANVIKSGKFVLFMLITCVFTSLSFTGYLMAAPYIYEGYFGFSPQIYAVFFGATAGISVLGVPLYKIISRFISLRVLTPILIVLSSIVGLTILCFGHLSVAIFFVSMVLTAIIGTMVRPYSMNILLEMRTDDIGAASSLMNFTPTVVGVLGTLPVLLIGAHYTVVIGALVVFGALISLTLWIVLMRSSYIIPKIKDR
jgi:DHA1 family bicyclomycin/chloramphenicol resistance-like MFS transporter